MVPEPSRLCEADRRLPSHWSRDTKDTLSSVLTHFAFLVGWCATDCTHPRLRCGMQEACVRLPPSSHSRLTQSEECFGFFSPPSFFFCSKSCGVWTPGPGFTTCCLLKFFNLSGPQFPRWHLERSRPDLQRWPLLGSHVLIWLRVVGFMFLCSLGTKNRT